jgi:TonB family protein
MGPPARVLVLLLAASTVVHGAGLALFARRIPAHVLHVPAAEEAPIELSALEASPAETTEPPAADGAPLVAARPATSPAAQATELSYEAQRARILAQLDDPSPPGAHAGTPVPLTGTARAAWWEAARKVPVGPLDSRDGYDAIRAQIAGWDEHLITGTYKPGGARIAHPEEMPSHRVPASVIASVVSSSAGRFHVCHGAGLPGSAGVSGEVVVAFTIETDGRVTNARDAGGVFPDGAVRRCVVRAVTQLSFQKPPLGVAQDVTVPIALPAEDATSRPGL